MDADVVGRLVAARRRQEHSPLAALTPREAAVLAEMAQGATNGAIAARLHVSESAVGKHVSAFFAKLGLADAASDRRMSAVLSYLRGEP